MVDLSLVEFSCKEKESKSEGRSSGLPGYMVDRPFAYSFVTAQVPEYYTEVNYISGSIARGMYDLKAGYTIIYLYDFNNDRESIDFIAEYGGKLHNQSSSNITILTYFTSYTVKHWRNVQYREEIQCADDRDKMRVFDIIDNIKKLYNVKTLPTMIVVKKDEDGKEHSFNIDFSIYKKDGIYQAFKDIIETINDNCEENFTLVAKKFAAGILKF